VSTFWQEIDKRFGYSGNSYGKMKRIRSYTNWSNSSWLRDSRQSKVLL
jgi:hypothetical protein